MKAVHAVGPWYTLYQAQENRDVTVTPAEGWWPAEPTHRWSGSKGNECSIYIDSQSDSTAISLAATFMELAADRDISVTVNGRALKGRQDRTTLETEPFVLQRGRNVVVFQTSFLPSPPTSWDPRTLSVGWISVAIHFPNPPIHP
jgi:hypothetical protein